MAFSANSSSGTSPEINVTPLIDVLLVLLIIFMVIGPALPHGLESAIPQTSAGAALEPPVTVRVLAGTLGSGTRYRIGAQDAAFADIRPRLRQLFAGRPERGEERTLYIDADRSLSFQEVARVAGEARAAGAGPVALAGSRTP